MKKHIVLLISLFIEHAIAACKSRCSKKGSSLSTTETILVAVLVPIGIILFCLFAYFCCPAGDSSGTSTIHYTAGGGGGGGGGGGC